MCLWTSRNWLKFRSHLHPDPDLDSSTLWGRVFCTVWLISLEKLIGSSQKFYHSLNFDTEVRTKLSKSSGCGSGVQTGFVLAKVNTLQMFFVNTAITSATMIQWTYTDVFRCLTTRRRYLSSRCGDYLSTRRKPRNSASSSDSCEEAELYRALCQINLLALYPVFTWSKISCENYRSCTE